MYNFYFKKSSHLFKRHKRCKDLLRQGCILHSSGLISTDRLTGGLVDILDDSAEEGWKDGP